MEENLNINWKIILALNYVATTVTYVKESLVSNRFLSILFLSILFLSTQIPL